MKLICVRKSKHYSEANDSDTIETVLSVDGVEYLYYSHFDSKSGTRYVKNLATGEVDGDNEVFKTINFLSNNIYSPLDDDINEDDTIDTSLFDVSDENIDIFAVPGAVT